MANHNTRSGGKKTVPADDSASPIAAGLAAAVLAVKRGITPADESQSPVGAGLAAAVLAVKRGIALDIEAEGVPAAKKEKTDPTLSPPGAAVTLASGGDSGTPVAVSPSENSLQKKKKKKARTSPKKAPSASKKSSAPSSCAAAGQKSTDPAGPPSHFVFITTTGYEVVSGIDNADVFRNDWKDFVVSSNAFSTEADAAAFARNLVPSPPSTPMKSVLDVDIEPPSPLSASAEARLSEVIASLQDKKPGNRINILYRTNCTSKACVVLVECLNMSGKHQWNVKPDILCDPIQMFPREFPDDPDSLPVRADDVVAQCFYNIHKLVLRDAAGGPEAPLQVKWTSPDKSREITYDQYLMATHFVIPLDDLSSTDEEDKLIAGKLQLFGACFKKVLTSPVFARLHEANCPKETVWKSMNGKGAKTGGFSFLEYVRDASLHVSKCHNLNQYVTKVEADTLMNVLWQARGTGPKY